MQLYTGVQAILRDIQGLRGSLGIHLTTRGQTLGSWPRANDKSVASGHWLSGQDPLEGVRRHNPHPAPVKCCIHTLCQVVVPRPKGVHPLHIAVAVGISSGGTQTILESYEAHGKQPEHARRFEAIESIFRGRRPRQGGPLPSLATSQSRRRPRCRSRSNGPAAAAGQFHSGPSTELLPQKEPSPPTVLNLVQGAVTSMTSASPSPMCVSSPSKAARSKRSAATQSTSTLYRSCV